MATTIDGVRAPLLEPSPIDHDTEAEVIIDIESNGGFDEGEVEDRLAAESRVSNPFEFLGGAADSFSVPAHTTIDPFRNNTPDVDGIYEWLKILICLPIAIVRLVLFGLSLAVGYVATKLALQGWKDKENPMPRWRRRVLWITRFSSRAILFSFGYHWIRRKGRPASREVAPIVVCNHVSYIDPIFFFYEMFPTIVASESHDSIPFVGTIIRAMQVIYVNRFSSTSRKHAVNEIKRKAACDRFPRVLLFPEGTTTNGRVLISFQLGAFIPGYPIQPAVVRYPHVHFDQSWGDISLARLMFRMFTQFHNFMEEAWGIVRATPIFDRVVGKLSLRWLDVAVHHEQKSAATEMTMCVAWDGPESHKDLDVPSHGGHGHVEYLPVISPLENKKENTVNFAQRTSYAIADALNVVHTSHSYGDVMLLTKASEMKQEILSRYCNLRSGEAVNLYAGNGQSGKFTFEAIHLARLKSTGGPVECFELTEFHCAARLQSNALSLFNITKLEAVEFLDRFLSMNPDRSGRVEIHDFLRVLKLPFCSLSEKIFEFIDLEKLRSISFRQFIFASAHILKLPSFWQACELSFADCDSSGSSYILEHQFGEYIRPAIPEIGDAEIRGLFNLFDIDGDGMISKDDFMLCLQRSPLLVALFHPRLWNKDLHVSGYGMLQRVL
ncbi:hypothetical protein Sjap_020725 [Stephania japonica]|uniref:EF-hand domain-containing protein n=1 Tax=Stephania japonica TaxID=461633 RepID=A0AAP0I0I2_9MAGN